VKVNVDGAFNQETGRAGIGIVIQNSAGVAIICAWKAIFEGMNAEEVEALACLEGCDWQRNGHRVKPLLNLIAHWLFKLLAVQVWINRGSLLL